MTKRLRLTTPNVRQGKMSTVSEATVSERERRLPRPSSSQIGLQEDCRSSYSLSPNTAIILG